MKKYLLFTLLFSLLNGQVWSRCFVINIGGRLADPGNGENYQNVFYNTSNKVNQEARRSGCEVLWLHDFNLPPHNLRLDNMSSADRVAAVRNHFAEKVREFKQQHNITSSDRISFAMTDHGRPSGAWPIYWNEATQTPTVVRPQEVLNSIAENFPQNHVSYHTNTCWPHMHEALMDQNPPNPRICGTSSVSKGNLSRFHRTKFENKTHAYVGWREIARRSSGISSTTVPSPVSIDNFMYADGGALSRDTENIDRNGSTLSYAYMSRELERAVGRDDFEFFPYTSEEYMENQRLGLRLRENRCQGTAQEIQQYWQLYRSVKDTMERDIRLRIEAMNSRHAPEFTRFRANYYQALSCLQSRNLIRSFEKFKIAQLRFNQKWALFRDSAREGERRTLFENIVRNGLQNNETEFKRLLSPIVGNKQAIKLYTQLGEIAAMDSFSGALENTSVFGTIVDAFINSAVSEMQDQEESMRHGNATQQRLKYCQRLMKDSLDVLNFLENNDDPNNSEQRARVARWKVFRRCERQSML